MMTVYIELTTAGADTGPFSLYSDVDGYISPFETGIPKASLVAGYTSFLVPNFTSIVRVKSEGPLCTNYINIPILITTTTTTTVFGINLSISNTSLDGIIEDIRPGTFYLISGGFPIGPGNSDSGTHGSYSGDIDVDVSGTNTSKLVLYINSIQVDCIDIPVNTLATYTFTSVSFSSLDTVAIQLEPGSC